MFSKFVHKLESIKFSYEWLIFAVIGVTFFRLFGEWFAEDFKVMKFSLIIHSIVFYLAMFFVNSHNMSLLLRDHWKKYFGVVLFGLLIGVLPPIVDIFNSNRFNENYDYLRQFSWHFFAEKEAFGESVAAWIWIIAFTFYIFFKTKSWQKTILALVISYFTVQFTAWVTFKCVFFIKTKYQMTQSIHILFSLWWLLIALILCVYRNWSYFKASFKRLHHSLIWGLLVLIGAKMSTGIQMLTFIQAFMMILSFLFILFVNDYYDKEFDELDARSSLIEKEHVIIITFMHILIICISGMISFSFCFLVGMFFLLGYFYNVPPMRLKNNFITSSLVEGIAAMICIMSGASLLALPESKYFLYVLFLSGIGFMIASNLKDYKDFSSDLKSGTNTLYVFYCKKGRKTKETNKIIAVTVFAALFWPAILLYFLKVKILYLFIASSMAAITSLCLIIIANPKKAVSFSIWSIVIYLSFMVFIFPKLP